MAYDKAKFIAEKKAEKENLEKEYKNLIKTALLDKTNIDALTSHYRIGGLYAYSFRNQIYIMLQGGHGCIAMSKTKWTGLGRTVLATERKENKIIIIMPVFRDEVNPNTGKKESVLKFFKNVGLYRVEQTEGKELEYEHNSIGDVDYDKVKEVCESITGVQAVEMYTGNARGFSDGKQLAVSVMSNDVDKAKTLIHETAHHILHTGNTSDKKQLSRETIEVEAESVAHLVNSYLGLDYELTTAYVSAYKSGIDAVRVSKVVAVAGKIIDKLKG